MTINDKKQIEIVLASRKMRRRMVIAILIYSAILIGTVTYLGRNQPSNKILETIVTCSYSLCGTVVAAYMATASYQDRNYIAKKGENIVKNVVEAVESKEDDNGQR